MFVVETPANHVVQPVTTGGADCCAWSASTPLSMLGEVTSPALALPSTARPGGAASGPRQPPGHNGRSPTSRFMYAELRDREAGDTRSAGQSERPGGMDPV